MNDKSELELNYLSEQMSRNMSDEKHWLINNSHLEDFSFWKYQLNSVSVENELLFKKAYAEYCDFVIRDGRMPLEYGLFWVRIKE